MAEFFPGWDWTLKVERYDRPPDEQWRHIDSNGHEHYVDRAANAYPAYPTLDLVIDKEHWCEGDEEWCDRAEDPWCEGGPRPHDPHMVADEVHFECKLCREVIALPKSYGGSVVYTLCGYNSAGVQVVLSLIDAEYERLSNADVDGGDPEAEVRRILDEAPAERLLSMSNFRDQPPDEDTCINPSCDKTGTVLVRWSVGPVLGKICADHAVEAMTSGQGEELQGGADGLATLILR